MLPHWAHGVMKAVAEWASFIRTSWKSNSDICFLAHPTRRLDDRRERFADAQRKHLGSASQDALKWVCKAIMVVRSRVSSKNFALVRLPTG